jgi:transglutaminase-like putative cysteine protease
MRFRITHVTRYAYDGPASESFMEARLTPSSDARQRLLTHRLETSPSARVHAYTDYFGNAVETFSLVRRHESLELTGISDVETTTLDVPAAAVDVSVSEARQISRSNRLPLLEFLLPSPALPLEAPVRRLASRFLRGGAPLGRSLLSLNAWLHREFTYRPGSTTIETPIATVLRTRTGVCQDFAQIMAAILRAGGIPARYVTGYIETNVQARANGTAANPLPLVGASESHAWVEAFLPGGFWLPLDPTNNCVAGERHVKVSVGRDYHDSTPTRGVFKGTQTRSLSVSVVMRRIGSPADRSAPIDGNR